MIDSLAKGKDPSYGYIEEQVKQEVQKRLEAGEIFIDEQAIRKELTDEYNESLKKTQKLFSDKWRESVDEEIENTNYQITSRLDRPVLTSLIKEEVDSQATEKIQKRLEVRRQMARILQNSIMKDVQDAKDRLRKENKTEDNK